MKVLLILIFAAGLLSCLFTGRSGARRAAVLGLCACCLMTAVSCASDVDDDPVCLSEACCANFCLELDPNTGDYEDYVELHNTCSDPVYLKGYCLSDDTGRLALFRMPEIELEPDGYLVLWADGTGSSGGAGKNGVSLNFKLKPGETVFLSSPHGRLIDSVTLPDLHKNISATRRGDGWVTAVGTPGASGDGAEQYAAPTLPAPQPNYPSGFYDSPIELSLTAPEGCEIRYTTDGSLPDKDDPIFPDQLQIADRSGEPNETLAHPDTTLDYSGAIKDPVDKGTVIRAAAFGKDGETGKVLTAVYFIGGERFSKYDGTAVLNLVADPDDLFGSLGIAVTGADYDQWIADGKPGDDRLPNYMQKGREWERDASVIYWNENREQLFDAECGVRLQGSYSRRRAIKRFAFFSRAIYGGSSVFQGDIFDGAATHSFYTRSGGGDAFVHEAVADLGLGGQSAVHAVVFVNGEMYDETYIRERYDERYFTSRFGVKKGDLVLAADDTIDIGTDADLAEYLALVEYITSNDCSDPAVYDEICRKIDVGSLAGLVACNLYLNNTDWSNKLNYRMWRTRSGDGEGVLDGRWRWLIFDLDACYWTRQEFGDAPRASYDLFHYPARRLKCDYIDMPVFGDLIKNPDFRDLFARTWLKLINVTFNYERVLPLIEKYGLSDSTFWVDFLKDRPKYAVGILIGALGMAGKECTLTLSVSDPAGGHITLDGAAPDLSGGSASCAYVTGLAPELTAVPAPGWKFAGWEGSSGGESATFSPALEGNAEFKAVFVRED
ncbi:MAG: CotH kinase family protein [Clostridia bacterium]|nr:CotH kinase family protein [Clostridia bacterium]